MSKSSEKPRLHQIPSEDMDSEDGGGTSPSEPAYHNRVRAGSLREAETTSSKSHEEQLQHALILNQVWRVPPVLPAWSCRWQRNSCTGTVIVFYNMII